MYPPVVKPTILRQAVTDKLCRNRYVYAFVAKNGKRLDSERGASPHTLVGYTPVLSDLAVPFWEPVPKTQ